MSWPVVIGVISGFVAGANLGVLLMVALRAGRQEETQVGAVLLARIEELEAALARQPASSLTTVEPVGRQAPASTGVGHAGEKPTHLSRPA